MKRLVLILSISILLGCGSDKKNPVNSGSDIQINNSPDTFQFTANGTANLSSLLDYTWSNSGTQATIIHSSTVDSGTALLYLYDGGGNLVYSNGLSASATEQSQVGTAGDWLVRVSLNNCWGNLSFHVQKL